MLALFDCTLTNTGWISDLSCKLTVFDGAITGAVIGIVIVSAFIMGEVYESERDRDAFYPYKKRGQL